jgi:hypothetical protein
MNINKILVTVLVAGIKLMEQETEGKDKEFK